MDFYAGIDGTGVGDNALYARLFADSFVHQLYRSNRFSLRYYTRGPTWEGATTKRIALSIHREIETRLHNRSARKVDRLILAGYSRGGASAIQLARELQRHNHPVHCLLLFDAVDMTWTLEADRIPSNVRYVFHARRHPASRSRPSWGNCGKAVEDARRTKYEEEFFLCTHGGMGGVPWKKEECDSDGIVNEAYTDAEDRAMLKRVRNSTPMRILRHIPVSPILPLPGSFPVDAADEANEAHRRASRTKIHYERDQIVSKAVGDWIGKNLNKVLGAHPATRKPALVG